jgi:hypothetical protein
VVRKSTLEQAVDERRSCVQSRMMRRSPPAVLLTLAHVVAMEGGCRSEARSQTVTPPPAQTHATTPMPKSAAPDARAVSDVDPFPEDVPADQSAPPRTPPAAEPHAPATTDCKIEHVAEPFIPRQSAQRATRTTPCSAFGDCAPLSPVTSRRRGCADFGSHCRPLLVMPEVERASAASARHVQDLLDVQIAYYLSDPNDCWLGWLDYTIHYNEDGILDVTFRVSGMGAYPDWHARRVAIDLARGEKLGASAFVAEKHEALAALVHNKLERALRGVDPKFLWNDEIRAFKKENLGDFMVTREGVVFLYDFHVAHVVRAHTPLSEYLLSWSVVRPFIDPKGPLGRVRR